MSVLFFFFFSSRRRHTRLQGDWSSDVCSSDLLVEGETGLTIARYNDLSTDKGLRRLSLYALDSYYYPVGTRGVVAPFAVTALGLARVTEVDSLCLLYSIPCSASTSATSQFALAFGLGMRVNVGGAVVATLAGRFLEVPGSQ